MDKRRLFLGSDGTLEPVVVRVQISVRDVLAPDSGLSAAVRRAAPVLFFDLPRKMLIFTALYPFVAYWLIWGGTILTPILALLGLLLAMLFTQRFVTRSFAAGFFGGVAAAIVVWAIGGCLSPSHCAKEPRLLLSRPVIWAASC